MEEGLARNEGREEGKARVNQVLHHNKYLIFQLKPSISDWARFPEVG